MEQGSEDLTQVLAALTDGDESAATLLMEIVYDELRALAGGFFRGQPAARTLQPTALVHEAFIRVTDRTGLQFKDRAHFFALCATVMRGILADYARKRRAAKRGGDWAASRSPRSRHRRATTNSTCLRSMKHWPNCPTCTTGRRGSSSTGSSPA